MNLSSRWWCKILHHNLLEALYIGVMFMQIRAMGWSVADVVNTVSMDDVSAATASVPPTTTQSVAPTQ